MAFNENDRVRMKRTGSSFERDYRNTDVGTVTRVETVGWQDGVSLWVKFDNGQSADGAPHYRFELAAEENK
jgi:hypothetical protein